MRRLALAAAVLATLSLAACGESGEEEGGPTMRPGENCLSCHTGGEPGRFTAAGTVYGAGNADAGDGLAGASVTLTGSGAGQVVTLTTNAAGNFFTSAPLTAPISVSITHGGQTATMSGATGACASCHYPGNAAAPDRVHVGTCAGCH